MSRPIHSLVIALMMCSLAACDDDSPVNPAAQDGVEVTLSARVLLAPSRAEGSLQLTRARVVLRDLKFHPVDGIEEMEFVTGPFVVELELDGSVNTVAAANVPADTYDEVRMKIHKLDDDDPRDLAALADPAFADFSGPDRLSVLIQGTYDAGGGPQEFTFASDLNEEQRKTLIPALTVTADDVGVNVTLAIDTSEWFSDGQGGALDPRNAANEDQIEQNIENSIDIFEDRDRDGTEDDS